MRDRREAVLMTGTTRRLFNLGSLAAATALLAVGAFLIGHRPGAPDLPNSFSSPVTIALFEQLALFAAWLLAWAVTVLLLVRSFRQLARRPHRPRLGAQPNWRDGSRVIGRTPRASAAPAFPPPFPLILRRQPERVGGVVGESATRSHAALRDELPRPFIAVLGPLEVATTRRRRRGLRSQTQELLAYLALHARGAATDELVAALWPNAQSDTAKVRVWRSLSEARSHLGDVVCRIDDRYVLDRHAVAVDLDRFDRLITRAHAGPADERESVIERALVLVRGEPLSGSDFPWAAGEIRYLLGRIVSVLEELAHHRLDSADPTGALAAAERAIALDAYNEPVHQLAMQAESFLGLRQAIVDRYDWLCGELDARFGLEPERETRAVYRRLLSQDARSHEPVRDTRRDPANSLNLR